MRVVVSILLYTREINNKHFYIHTCFSLSLYIYIYIYIYISRLLERALFPHKYATTP